MVCAAASVDEEEGRIVHFIGKVNPEVNWFMSNTTNLPSLVQVTGNREAIVSVSWLQTCSYAPPLPLLLFYCTLA